MDLYFLTCDMRTWKRWLRQQHEKWIALTSNETGESIPDIYYQEVVNNLAMIQADPSRMPYFSDPQTSRT